MDRYSGTVKAGGIQMLLDGVWDLVILGCCDKKVNHLRKITTIYSQYLDDMGTTWRFVRPTLREVSVLKRGYAEDCKTGNVLWLCSCEVSVRKRYVEELQNNIMSSKKCYGIFFACKL